MVEQMVAMADILHYGRATMRDIRRAAEASGLSVRAIMMNKVTVADQTGH